MAEYKCWCEECGSTFQATDPAVVVCETCYVDVRMAFLDSPEGLALSQDEQQQLRDNNLPSPYSMFMRRFIKALEYCGVVIRK